ncbi:hypothetical protein GCM10010377_79880 [Streptomyces viridiviolaceus]|uniref:Rv3660c-like CheY-like N-terminal domain-containing protein n=1 Tax=Streptomyces viridiviolaceus TaxID=68282 RepID=A0ABW2DXH2_9ACTN|nr:hypothetical protein [Streptomyces viridiviolaceus]GHB77637.1 hypothetical protein GCM10010377_79880 [Streptomyces viridiviolaceus]
MLVISDSPDADPVGLLPCKVPLRHLPSPLFGADEYRLAPLVILDDRSYTAFRLRHMPHRPGLILALADTDDDTVYPQAAAIGAEAVIRTGQDLSWLHLRLHEATGCHYANWEDLLTGPPPPSGS